VKVVNEVVKKTRYICLKKYRTIEADRASKKGMKTYKPDSVLMYALTPAVQSVFRNSQMTRSAHMAVPEVNKYDSIQIVRIEPHSILEQNSLTIRMNKA
jgi:hypothetical protein